VTAAAAHPAATTSHGLKHKNEWAGRSTGPFFDSYADPFALPQTPAESADQPPSSGPVWRVSRLKTELPLCGHPLVARLSRFFLCNSRLEATTRIGMLQPGERKHTDGQASEQRNHQHPDPEAALLRGGLFHRQRRHSPPRLVRIAIVGIRAGRLSWRFWPGRRYGRLCAIQRLQIGATVFAEPPAARVLPRTIGTGYQSIASWLRQRLSANSRILNRRRQRTSVRRSGIIIVPSEDRVHLAIRSRSD
jgi:hypothetical protein